MPLVYPSEKSMAKKRSGPRNKKLPVEECIEKFAPFGLLKTRKALALQWQDVRPVIRLAHRKKRDLILAPRIIFDYLVIFVIEGEGTFQLGSETRPVKEGHLLLIPPFCPHSFDMPNPECDHIAIHFDWKPQFPQQPRQSTGRKPYQIRLPFAVEIPSQQLLASYDPLATQFQQVVDAWQKNQDISRLRADAIFFEIIATLLERLHLQATATPPRHIHTDQARIHAAIAFMQEHLGETIGTEMIAQAAGLSSSHFSRLFRKWTGHSPIEHLTRLRIKRAKELMGDIHLTIKQVAVLCGFEDSHYFSKVFARLDGLPPSQYRETMLAQRVTPQSSAKNR
jgi:AraC-like DNA-binding protein